MIGLKFAIELKCEVADYASDFIFNIHSAQTRCRSVIAELPHLNQRIAPVIYTDPTYGTALHAVEGRAGAVGRALLRDGRYRSSHRIARASCESADPATERAPATRIERNRVRGAPIRRCYKVSAAGNAGNARIDFPITPFTYLVGYQAAEDEFFVGCLKLKLQGGKMSGKKLMLSMCLVTAWTATTSVAGGQENRKMTPADGHTIHVLAPHVLDGKVMGPYHHYCKTVSAEVLECLIYESTEPNALLKQVEYFVAKSVTRPNVPLATWNKFYHDHAVEIATGRVQVLDQSPEDAKKTAEAAARTDGIIFHLWWPDDAKAPSGVVKHPQSVGHKPRTK